MEPNNDKYHMYHLLKRRNLLYHAIDQKFKFMSVWTYQSVIGKSIGVLMEYQTVKTNPNPAPGEPQISQEHHCRWHNFSALVLFSKHIDSHDKFIQVVTTWANELTILANDKTIKHPGSINSLCASQYKLDKKFDKEGFQKVLDQILEKVKGEDYFERKVVHIRNTFTQKRQKKHSKKELQRKREEKLGRKVENQQIDAPTSPVHQHQQYKAEDVISNSTITRSDFTSAYLSICSPEVPQQKAKYLYSLKVMEVFMKYGIESMGKLLDFKGEVKSRVMKRESHLNKYCNAPGYFRMKDEDYVIPAVNLHRCVLLKEFTLHTDEKIKQLQANDLSNTKVKDPLITFGLLQNWLTDGLLFQSKLLVLQIMSLMKKQDPIALHNSLGDEYLMLEDYQTLDNEFGFYDFKKLYEIDLQDFQLAGFYADDQQAKIPIHILRVLAYSALTGYSGPWVIQLNHYSPGSSTGVRTPEFAVVKLLEDQKVKGHYTLIVITMQGWIEIDLADILLIKDKFKDGQCSVNHVFRHLNIDNDKIDPLFDAKRYKYHGQDLEKVTIAELGGFQCEEGDDLERFLGEENQLKVLIPRERCETYAAAVVVKNILAGTFQSRIHGRIGILNPATNERVHRKEYTTMKLYAVVKNADPPSVEPMNPFHSAIKQMLIEFNKYSEVSDSATLNTMLFLRMGSNLDISYENLEQFSVLSYYLFHEKKEPQFAAKYEEILARTPLNDTFQALVNKTVNDQREILLEALLRTHQCKSTKGGFTMKICEVKVLQEINKELDETLESLATMKMEILKFLKNIPPPGRNGSQKAVGELYDRTNKLMRDSYDIHFSFKVIFQAAYNYLMKIGGNKTRWIELERDSRNYKKAHREETRNLDIPAAKLMQRVSHEQAKDVKKKKGLPIDKEEEKEGHIPQIKEKEFKKLGRRDQRKLKQAEYSKRSLTEREAANRANQDNYQRISQSYQCEVDYRHFGTGDLHTFSYQLSELFDKVHLFAIMKRFRHDSKAFEGFEQLEIIANATNEDVLRVIAEQVQEPPQEDQKEHKVHFVRYTPEGRLKDEKHPTIKKLRKSKAEYMYMQRNEFWIPSKVCKDGKGYKVFTPNQMNDMFRHLVQNQLLLDSNSALMDVQPERMFIQGVQSPQYFPHYNSQDPMEKSTTEKSSIGTKNTPFKKDGITGHFDQAKYGTSLPSYSKGKHATDHGTKVLKMKNDDEESFIEPNDSKVAE